jgi:DNA-binding CsgD family transcriptional regulator/tetratricopeptide (TPR) repeat protein
VRIEYRPETGPRVRMLHTVREFAEEQLHLAGETETIQRAHAMWYATMIIETPNTTWGTGRPELRTWTLRHMPDRSTFTTVLKRLMAWGEHETALEMTAQLVSFWNEVGQIRESIEWCDQVMPYAEGLSTKSRANFFFKAALVLHMVNRVDEALTYAKRSLKLYEEIGDLRSVANTHNIVGNLQWQRGDFEEGERHQRKAIETTMADNNSAGTAMFKAQLADRLAERGKYDEAERLLEEAEPVIARERAEAMPLILGSKALLYLMTDRVDEAARSMRESLEYFMTPPIRRPDMLAQLLLYAADVAARRGIGDLGAMVLGAARTIFDEIGMKMNEDLREEVDRIVSSLHTLLDNLPFNERVRSGAGLPVEDAIRIAVSICDAPPSTEPVVPGAIEPDDDLTPREREVLRLLAAGKSNAAIADELFISQRTVTTHLTRLYAKLDVTSRTAAISAALRMGIIDPT